MRRARPQRREVRVRRSRHLLLYWRRGRLIVHNFATRAQVVGTPSLCQLLDYCGEWRTADEIRSALGVTRASAVRTLIGRLVSRGFLERSGYPETPQARAMDLWERWNPEAGFFHQASKDVRFWLPMAAARHAEAKLADSPMPRPVKRYRGAPTLDLPPPKSGPFADVLRARRTWRRFSRAPVDLDELATILGLSLGVMHWVETPGGNVPLKTSPSGGARHPIEGYVLARDVHGLTSGVYHYASDRHRLERIRGPVAQSRIGRYFPSSRYFAGAPVLVFLTAVFERQAWRYPYARAYRAALAEAGHVCQTFCLVATWLGLAPFCLMGLADSTIEEDLGLDGLSESVLYAAGLGRRPKGAWSPYGSTIRQQPKIRPNLRLG